MRSQTTVLLQLPHPNRVETMHDLVFRTGIHESLSYAHLYRVIFDPSEGITLHFTDHIVMIKGYHLRDLYRNIKNHRATYVCEADNSTVQLESSSEPIVKAIVIVLPK